MDKKQVLKKLRNVVVTIVVMIVVVGGAGAGYVWYMGQQAPPEVLSATIPEKKPERLPGEPIKPAADAPVGASIQMLTASVKPGENASVSVRTTPTAVCDIKVEYNKVVSTDSGLVQRAADDYGVVSWTWTVDQGAALGKWPVKATCAYGGKTAVVVGDLEVKSN